MNRWMILLLFLLGTSVCYAQKNGGDFGWLRGEVKDAGTGKPIAFVKIQALFGASLWEGMTDYDGNYVIRVPWGPFVMTADSHGYELIKKVGIVDEERMTFVDVELVRSVDR